MSGSMVSRVGAPFVVALAALALSACASSKVNKKAGLSSDEGGYSPRLVSTGKPVPKGGGHRKLGSPYRIGGRLYTPRVDRSYDRKGIASWYGDKFHGRLTANGEVFDMNRLTAAHPTLPLPSLVRVTNLENGRVVLVRVNDRGPYAHDRIIDLSRRVAGELGMRNQGTARVRVQYVGEAPLSGDDRREETFLRGQKRSSRYAANMPSAPSQAGRSPRTRPVRAAVRPR
ncbi:MAG: septal ring lytic transglycosylase RlpA family protein, partial [Pseudomonadota bacterium]